MIQAKEKNGYSKIGNGGERFRGEMIGSTHGKFSWRAREGMAIVVTSSTDRDREGLTLTGTVRIGEIQVPYGVLADAGDFCAK